MDELKEYLKSRIKHPFLGTFTIAVILANWQILLIATTGSLEPAQRIAMITALPVNLENSIGWPALFAAFFVILYPVFSLLANILYHAIQIRENNLKEALTEKNDNSSDKKFTKVREIAIKHSKVLSAICGDFDTNLPLVSDAKLREELYKSLAKCKAASEQLRSDVNTHNTVNNAFERFKK